MKSGRMSWAWHAARMVERGEEEESICICIYFMSIDHYI
jgi:hypothetical protein